MKRTQGVVAAVLIGVAVLAGCNGDGDNAAPAGPSSVQTPAGPTSVPNPPPPPLGRSQIDRMGRAGVNTALTNPFFRESVASEESVHEIILNDYNAASDPAQWGTEFAAIIAANLAILDSLDRVCGNQLLAGPTPVVGRYNALARVLADDQLYVNTASGTCNQYLAVEANAVGIANTDCGGRTPLANTIDVTYSLLAAGTLSGVTNGVTVDGDGRASLTALPFLDRPN